MELSGIGKLSDYLGGVKMFSNFDIRGIRTESDVLAWIPNKITTTGAEDVVVKKRDGIIGNLYVATADLAVTIKDGEEEVRPALTGVGEDDYRFLPIICGTSIVLSFSGAGIAYIVYR